MQNSTIIEILFENISGFKDYYFNSGYDNEDLDLPYIVVGVLNSYIKEKYLDNEYNIVGDKTELYSIFSIIKDFLNSNDNELSTLAIIGFIEGISQQAGNGTRMKNLRESLHFEELQLGLDEVNRFWGMS